MVRRFSRLPQVGGADRDGGSMLERARSLADGLLFPDAQDVDRAPLVPKSRLAALADAGLFGIAGPQSHGGSALDRGDAWRTAAALFGGCGATAFVWAQHQGVVRTVARSTNDGVRDGHLAGLCAGTEIAGVAFAHLRRSGPPAIVATRVEGGWRLDGFSPWTTSWGLADWFAIAAESHAGEVVWALLGADAGGVRADPLALPVFASTGTVTLVFEECVVPDDRVVLIESARDWRAADRLTSAIGAPATVGIAERCIRLLEQVDDAAAVEAAGRLAGEHAAAVARYDALLDAIAGGGDVLEAASEHRARLIHLAKRSSMALLAAVGGRGMDLAHPAQRLAREADFFVIQAQTADGRTATLRGI